MLILTLTAAAVLGKMNFVLYYPDTLRAESFNAYGLGVPGVTPHFDEFAKSGVLFEQAHVMHTQCSPSRCTMLTGRYMHIGGHRTLTHLVQDYEPNYMRALKDAGYHVQWYGKNDAMSLASFNLSVSHWEMGLGYGSGQNAFTYPDQGWFSFLYTGGSHLGNDTAASDDYNNVVKAVEWMKDSPPEPFLLFIPNRGAHPPYGAPVDWHNKFPVDVVKEHVSLRPRNLPDMPVYMGYKNGIPKWRNLTNLPEDTFYKIQSVYLGMIGYTDWIFGQLLKGIEEAGLSDNTAVFFSSDHGDFGGDYGLVEKWPGSMADILTRVPLAARIPGGAQGVVSKAPMQSADMFETMIDLAGVNVSFVRFGVSLSDTLQNGTEGDMGRFVYGEGGFYFENEHMIEANECLSYCPNGTYCPRGQEEAQPNGSPRATMIRNATHKLVYRPTGVSELYDYTADPREVQNLYGNPSHAGLQQDLTKRLLDWLVLTSDITPTYQDSRKTPKYPQPLGPDPWAYDFLRVNGVKP